LRPVDLIIRKRDGAELGEEEIDFLVQGIARGEIPDYQAAAFLMAVVCRGMNDAETARLTRAMIRSGEVIDLSGVGGPLVDKHSTGGVGDKVSLPLAPLAAACGLRVPMMSGRSLGHTGGTLDKLESIPGYRTDLSPARFAEGIERVGFAMIGQSDTVVPADRRLYALRDVTGTVESVPLITASILSKKFAEGSSALVFDVKTGSGAFMQRPEQARELAVSLVRAAGELGRRAAACITDMDQPLGRTVGNFLEVEEAVGCMQGRGPADLEALTLRLAGWMLTLGGLCPDPDEGERIARTRLADGSAWRRFLANVEFQGGDVQALLDPRRSPRARMSRPVTTPTRGYVRRVDARAIGVAGVVLGAGRSRKEDRVLPGVGVTLLKVRGDQVRANDELALVHADDEARSDEARRLVAGAYAIGEAPPPDHPLVIEEITGS
jgi:pyrimidine-nucleoside phosphorylase